MDYSPIWISLKTAGATILVVFFVGLAVAKAVASLRKEKLKMILDGILTLPLVLPPTVAGFFLLYIFGVHRPVGSFFIEYFSVRIAFSWGGYGAGRRGDLFSADVPLCQRSPGAGR